GLRPAVLAGAMADGLGADAELRGDGGEGGALAAEATRLRPLLGRERRREHWGVGLGCRTGSRTAAAGPSAPGRWVRRAERRRTQLSSACIPLKEVGTCQTIVLMRPIRVTLLHTS